MQLGGQAEDAVGLLGVVDRECLDVALPVAQAGDALRLRELLLALANVPVGQQDRERVGESVADLDEESLLLRVPPPRGGALVEAQDPGTPDLGLIAMARIARGGATPSGTTTEATSSAFSCTAESDSSTRRCRLAVPVGQRQLDTERQAARILGPRALHHRRPGLALRLEEPRAIAREHLDQHRQSRVQRLPRSLEPWIARWTASRLSRNHTYPMSLSCTGGGWGDLFPTSKSPRPRPTGAERNRSVACVASRIARWSHWLTDSFGGRFASRSKVHGERYVDHLTCRLSNAGGVVRSIASQLVSPARRSLVDLTAAAHAEQSLSGRSERRPPRR